MGSAAKALGTMWSRPPACTVQSAMSTSAAVLLTLHRSPDTKKVRFPLTRKRTFLRYVWSQLRDSNLRPADYESAALPTELSWHHDGSGLRCSVLQCPALFGSSRSAERIYYPKVPRTSNTFCAFGQIFFASVQIPGTKRLCAPLRARLAVASFGGQGCQRAYSPLRATRKGIQCSSSLSSRVVPISQEKPCQPFFSAMDRARPWALMMG